MKDKVWIAFAALFVSATALASPRNAKQEADIDAELNAIDPSLVASAHVANDAADRADWATAAKQYKDVHVRAPAVVAITRRLGTAEAHNDDWQIGVGHCREAVKQEPSAENEAALAMAILSARVVVPNDADDAVKHARRAVDLAPDAEFSHVTLCEAAVAAKDTSALNVCSEKLRVIAPQLAMTHVYSSYAFASHQDWDGAQRELDVAHASGLDEAKYTKLRHDLEVARELHKDPWYVAIIPPVLASWIGAMFVLFVLGMLLDDGAARTQSRFARRAHQIVLRVASLSFWPSAILCTAIFGFVVFQIVWRFLWMTAAPRWVLAAVGAAVLYILIATARALFSRVDRAEHDFRTRIDLDEEDDLREALEAASSNAGVAIDEVWMTPGATVEARCAQKCVTLIGAAALAGLSRRELMALVAYELAKLSDSAIIERSKLDALSDRLEARGFESSANPMWWFVKLHRMFFNRISSGAARAAELRAEKMVKTSYGATVLATARDHVEDSADEIAARVAVAIGSALEGNRDDAKFYESSAAGEDAAWSLFSNRAELEDVMSKKLWMMIRERAGFAFDQASSASSVARA